MIGGPPMMSLPVYPATYPGQYNGTPIAPQPRLATPAPLPFASTAPAPVAHQAPPRRVIRAQAAEDISPPIRPAPPVQRATALTIPTPEELGVLDGKSAESASADWTSIHKLLNQLGASCFQLERLSDGGCRITCLLPTGQQRRSHRVEAQAASEADAARLFLARVEQWPAGR